MTNWNEIVPHGRAFIKMQGAQNHFVIVDGRASVFRPSENEIRRICDISEGVGAEQLMVVEQCTGSTHEAYARVRMYNTDGKEAQACANGTRCAALLLMQEAAVDKLLLEVGGRTLLCQKKGNDISVAMGEVFTNWKEIPLSGPDDTLHFQPADCRAIDAVAVNIGNPHVVIFVDDTDNLNMAELGREIQKSNSLPESANIGFAKVINDTKIELQVWERPGILTKACGSGACAAVFAAIQRGLIQSKRVYVKMPGGQLEVNCRDTANLVISGPAEYCFSGYLSS